MSDLNEDRRDDLQALVALIESEDLQALEEQGATFNPFDVLGNVHREATHSAVLAWLCSPSETHGFGDAFLRLFVRLVARQADEMGVGREVHADAYGPSAPMQRPTLFDVDGWDLGGAEVRREWRNIDLLVVDHELEFALVVENKVWSKEHSDQLPRYLEVADRALASCRQYLHAYLTPAGDPPSDERYVPVSYADIAGLLDRLVTSRRSNTATEVLAFIEQYRDTITEHIVEDSEIAEACRRIYRNHKRAIDLIVEHMPDDHNRRAEVLERILNEDDDLIVDDVSPTKIKFLPRALDGIPHAATGWTASGRSILFEFWNYKRKGLDLLVYLGPGDDDVRRKIHEVAHRQTALFNSARGAEPSPLWQRLFKRQVFSEEELASIDPSELEDVLREGVEALKQGPIREMVQALADLEWSDPT